MAGMANSITDYIGIVKVDGTEYLTGSTLFGTCTTDANEAAKKVVIEEITNFTPTHGLTIHVLFTHTNTAASPTLQFSPESTATTYPIYAYGNSPVGNTLSTSWHDNAIVSFTFYDGALDQTATAKRWIMNSGTDTGADGLAAVNLVNVNNADDLKAIEALTKANGYLKKTAANTWTLVDDQEASSTVAGITKIGASGGAATYEHTHGNITNSGALQTSDVTIGNGDKLVITDSSDGNKVARASLSFGANNATNKGKALTQAGTWESFTNNLGTVTSITPGAGLVKGNTTSTDTTAITDSGTISIKQGGVTNDMLAGSIENSKLSHHSITIGSVTKNLGETFNLSDLGITAAMNFKGTTTTEMEDGRTTKAVTIGGETYTPTNGDVVLYGGKEYIWTGTIWEQLGDESSWALASAVINTTGTKGDLLYWSDTDNPSHLNIGTGNNKFLTINNGVPVWGTIAKSDIIGLENVTNYAQVTSLQWDSTGKKITYKVSEAATATNVVQFIEGSNITLNAEDGKITIAGTANNAVTQAYSTADNSYPLLFSAKAGISSTSSRGTTTAIVNNAIYGNPSTGELHATKFIGNGSELTGITTNQISGTGTGEQYLRQDGWKTLSVSVTENANGKVLTGFTYTEGTLPTFTQGTKAKASVLNGILTIVNQTDDTFTQGTITTITNIKKANLGISGN